MLVLLTTDTVSAQKKRNRNRNNKNKGADQCHQKEVMKCLDKLSALGKEEDPTSIIATSQGLNRICKYVFLYSMLHFLMLFFSLRTIKDDTIKCVKSYFKKCGTPLHRELSDMVIDVIMHRVTRFCDNSQQKSSK